MNNLGPAIPPEVMETIFDPFQRGEGEGGAPRNQRGLGLGLFIVQEIARAHGGTATVTNDPARGTTFTVVLPRSG